VRASKPVLRFVDTFNAGVAALTTSPRWGRLVGRNIVIITYTGRRSGRTFSTPVACRRTGDDITIAVKLPEAKNWWRNFLDTGGPLTLRLNGINRTGHATARRDASGRVTVTVQHLSPTTGPASAP
jgi:hypothetical protein